MAFLIPSSLTSLVINLATFLTLFTAFPIATPLKLVIINKSFSASPKV